MFESSEDICEALARHTELSGSDVFEKNYVKDERVVCTVWCLLGADAEEFVVMARQWLADRGYKSDS